MLDPKNRDKNQDNKPNDENSSEELDSRLVDVFEDNDEETRRCTKEEIKNLREYKRFTHLEDL